MISVIENNIFVSLLLDTSSECGVAVLDVQNALKVLEKNCTNSDKTYICKRLEQTASAIILILDSKTEEENIILEKIYKDLYMQALVKIRNNCKKVNLQNIHKAQYSILTLISFIAMLRMIFSPPQPNFSAALKVQINLCKFEKSSVDS